MNEEIIHGVIHAGETLHGTIQATERLIGTIYMGGVDYYDGEYVIIPKTVDQKMKTHNKTMQDDVTVKAIPYFEVFNDKGGVTATIGGI